MIMKFSNDLVAQATFRFLRVSAAPLTGFTFSGDSHIPRVRLRRRRRRPAGGTGSTGAFIFISFHFISRPHSSSTSMNIET